MTTYFQCRLRRSDYETVGWIEKRGAKVGARVELKGAEFGNIEMIEESDSLWTVLEVYGPGLDEAVLRQKQANDRHALSSIAGR